MCDSSYSKAFHVCTGLPFVINLWAIFCTAIRKINLIILTFESLFAPFTLVHCHYDDSRSLLHRFSHFNLLVPRWAVLVCSSAKWMRRTGMNWNQRNGKCQRCQGLLLTLIFPVSRQNFTGSEKHFCYASSTLIVFESSKRSFGPFF